MAEEIMSAFDQFWEIYPRKVGKKVAKQVWEKNKLDEKRSEIIEAVSLQHRFLWAGKKAEYIPHPSTWLRQERWEDDIQSADPQSSPVSRKPEIEPPPQSCRYHAWLNRRVLSEIMKRNGVSMPVLRQLVGYKRHVAKQWQDMWKDHFSEEEFKDISVQVAQTIQKIASGKAKF